MVTYRYHRSSERIRSRLGSSAGGPIAHTSQRYPNRYNKGDGYGKSTRTIDHSTGDWARTRQGKSLPGYHPTPPRELSGWGKALKAADDRRVRRGMAEVAKKLGLFAGRLNPYIRAVDLAFDVYSAWQDPEEGPGWYKYEQPLHDAALAAGWRVCCDIGYSGVGTLKYATFPATVGIYTEPYDPGGCGYHTGCGVLGQVPQGDLTAESFTVPSRFNNVNAPRWFVKIIHTGIGQSRFTYQRKYAWQQYVPGLTRTPEVRVVPGKYVIPYGAVQPDSPAITETYTPASNRPKNRRPQMPYEVPSIDLSINPGDSGHKPPTTGTHVKKPPGPYDKEKKSKPPLKDALAAAGRLYDGATEIGDIVDAIADAIPQCKAVKGGIIPRLNCIYDNFDSLDLPQAVRNIAYNEAEDSIVGGIHKFGKKAKAPFGSSIYGGYTR